MAANVASTVVRRHVREPGAWVATVRVVDDRRFIEVPIEDGEVLVWCRGPVERNTHAVLFLHDRAENAKVWDLVMSRLPTGVALIAPDLRGRGSAWRAPVSSGVLSHIHDLDAILDRLDIDHVVAVGHGFGASVAGEFGRRRAERVVMTVGITGAAVIDPFDPVLGIGFGGRLEHQRFWKQHPILANAAGSSAVEDFIAHGIAGPADHHRWRADIRSLLADDASVRDLEPPTFTRSLRVGQASDELRQVELTAQSIGTVAHLLGVDPSIVLLTDVGADAVVAQIQPLLAPT